MYDLSTDTTELIGNNLVESLKIARETVHESRRAVEELTSAITQLVYEEDRRRKEFAEVLATIQAELNTVQNKCITVHWRHSEDSTLTSSLKELSKDMLQLTDLVSSSNIEEMKEIIEDLANW